MPGASDQTRRIKALNANWVPDEVAGGDGRFEVMLVTDDDARHVLAPSPATLTVLVALAQADAMLLWDPTNKTLIAANIAGEWLPSQP
jgi:hypothetical protein